MALTPFVPMEKKRLSDPLLEQMALALKAAGYAPNYRTAFHLALGIIIDLWCTADDHADEDGVIPFSRAQLEEKIGFDVVPYLPARWFVTLPDGRFQLPNFWSKNGAPAKYRAREAAARAEERKKSREEAKGARKEFREGAEKIPQGGGENSSLRSDPNRSDPSEEEQRKRESTHSADPCARKEFRTDPEEVRKKFRTEGEGGSYEATVTDLQNFERFLEAMPAHLHLPRREQTIAAAVHVVRSRQATWAELIAKAHAYNRWCVRTRKSGTDAVSAPLNWLQRAVWREDFDKLAGVETDASALVRVNADEVRALIEAEQRAAGGKP